MTKIQNKNFQKRDNSVVSWNVARIDNAIKLAANAAGVKLNGFAKLLAGNVEERVMKLDGDVVYIEDVQDIVEQTLIDAKQYEVAICYIKYRLRRATLREGLAAEADSIALVDAYESQLDWEVRENANMAYSFQGLVLKLQGEAQKRKFLSFLTLAQKKAHDEGYLHIHDLSFGLAGYCAGWSLRDLLLEGFSCPDRPGAAGPAKHFKVALGQMNNFLGTLQNEWAGAQAFNNVDIYLAPFVRAEADRLKERDLKKREQARREMVAEQAIECDEAWLQSMREQDERNYEVDKEELYGLVKQAMQEFIFNINTTSRWGGQTPFTNITLDMTCPKHMRNEAVIIGGKLHESWTYGDFQSEMEMINKAFAEIMLKGDNKGNMFPFPIPTYNVTKDFPWETEVGELIAMMTAKYGTAYFQNFINSDLNPEDVRSMCCRLQMDLREIRERTGGLFGAGDLTGSIGVVTLNLAKLAYLSRSATNPEMAFLDMIEAQAEMAKDILEIKRKELNRRFDAGFYPWTKKYLKNGYKGHFSTIGLTAGHEACLNLIGKGIDTPEGVTLMQNVLGRLRLCVSRFQENTGNLYNLEATPAEGTGYRLARLDKMAHADIIQSGNGTPYYTNSTALPVGKTENVLEALEHQNQLQPLYSGGTVFHTMLGEAVADPKSISTFIIKAFTKTKIPYVSVTPTFSICEDHGYILGEHFDCPKCGKEASVYTRVVGYYRPVARWNEGKQAEYEDRIEFNSIAV